jgi:hypothetical protein
MKWNRRRRAQSLLKRGVDEDVARELEFHLAMREQSLRAAGTQASEARVRAEREFGDVRGIDRRAVGDADQVRAQFAGLGLDFIRGQTPLECVNHALSPSGAS